MRIKTKISDLKTTADLVHEYRNRIRSRLSEFVGKLLQAGVQIASAKVYDMGAVDTGDLDSSIHYLISDDGKRGWIRTDSDHAVYVEFGTGIKGAGAPHPKPPAGWVYDINRHGQQGWWYPSDVTDPNPYKRQDASGAWWAWTRGMTSRPFMFETATELANQAVEVAKEVFRI